MDKTQIKRKVKIRFWFLTAYIATPVVLACALILLLTPFRRFDWAQDLGQDCLDICNTVLAWRQETLRWYAISLRDGYTLTFKD